MADCSTTCPSPSPKTPIPEDEDARNEELAKLAKALGHPARVAIVRFLMKRSSCVCGEIVEMLPLAQSTVSQHLKLLRDAGLLRGEINGKSTCYCIDPTVMDRLKKLVLDL
jgi:ArsR family transcriptional regulator